MGNLWAVNNRHSLQKRWRLHTWCFTATAWYQLKASQECKTIDSVLILEMKAKQDVVKEAGGKMSMSLCSSSSSSCFLPFQLIWLCCSATSKPAILPPQKREKCRPGWKTWEKPRGKEKKEKKREVNETVQPSRSPS